MEKSNNPLLAEIQDLIKEKFDLETWPSMVGDAYNPELLNYGEWIDVYVSGEESYIFTVGVLEDKLVIYRPGKDSFGYDNAISLYNRGFLEELWDQIEEVISRITE